MKRLDPVMPQVDESLCTLCGLCVQACPCGAVTLGERGPIFIALPGCHEEVECAEDGGCCCLYLCEEVCPTGAITCTFEILLEEGPNIGAAESTEISP